MYFTYFQACGQPLQKGVSCGWVDFDHLSFWRYCISLKNRVRCVVPNFGLAAGVILWFNDLQILVSHLEPLTDQQLMGLCNLQHSSQQAEDALSQGMEALQQSLSETLASASLVPAGGADNVSNYMGQMTIAMGKLSTLENFLRQVSYACLLTMNSCSLYVSYMQQSSKYCEMHAFAVIFCIDTILCFLWK